jgi:predicted nuclease of predicted toxin-antitoxin system
LKLLFDQNLSHQIKDKLNELFPGSMHVKDLGLEKKSDSDIWDFSKNNGFTIVSKDSDFHQRSFLFGHPPKFIWIKKGNCSTEEILSILRVHHEEIMTFGKDPVSSFLVFE